MAQSETLREFLVKLGFDVDPASWAKFKSRVEEGTKHAAEFGAAVTGVAVAATAMVNNLAEGMESLYFLSQRARSATGALQALGYAAGNIGLDPNAVQNLVGNMRMQMREQPGLAGLLESMGINPGEDTTRILNQLVGHLSHMPFYIASQYGEMFGIDPATLQRMIQNLPEMLRGEKQFAEMQKEMGVNAGQAAASFHEYENRLREAKNRVYVFAQAMGIALEPSMKAAADVVNRLLVDLVKLVDQNKKIINQDVIFYLQRFSRWVEHIDLKPLIGGIKEFGGGMEWIAQHSGGWQTVIAGMLALITLRVTGLTGALTALALAASPKKLGIIGMLIGGGIAADRAFEYYKKQGSGNALQGFEQEIQHVMQQFAAAGGNEQAVTGAGPLGLRNNNPGNLQPGGHEAHYATMAQGLHAMAALLVSYSKHGLNTIRKIISKYAPASAGNPTASYIRNISAALGISPDRVLDLAHNPQLLARLMGPMVNFENGQNPIAPSALLAAARSVSHAVNINPNVNITVNGSDDPYKTANEIGKHENRMYADLLHNFHVGAY